MTRRVPTLLLALATLTALPALAQVPLLEKGPELAKLDVLVGDWQGRLERMRPGGKTLVLESRETFGWAVGGAWLRGHDQTRLPDGGLIHNLTWITWDAEEKVYAGAWQDNVFPALVTFRGRWLDDRRLELDSGTFPLRGREHRVVLVYTLVSDDVFTTEMHQAWDGAEPTKVAETRFTRVE